MKKLSPRREDEENGSSVPAAGVTRRAVEVLGTRSI
jgi:hypothetical protein